MKSAINSSCAVTARPSQSQRPSARGTVSVRAARQVGLEVCILITLHSNLHTLLCKPSTGCPDASVMSDQIQHRTDPVACRMHSSHPCSSFLAQLLPPS